jgi:transcriptional regulator with XRE-family HTH domain
MNDFEFGNYLCALRTSLCLSQLLLGRLCGVTDKAVSKWETGAAKPRIGTCHKLAEIFDVSVDELLSGGKKMNVSEQRSKKLREDFHSSLEHALTEKYGPHPSLECVGRMQSEEMQDLLPENFIHNLNWLSRLFAEGHEKNFDVLVRGDLGSWFSAWLLGCSAVNPLPPHYYCPYCHKVEFVYDAYDGWDLPEKECCGHPMKQDGHRIPFEGSFLSARRSQDIEFDIAKRYLPNALGIISDYYRGIRQIVPTIFEDRQQPGVEVTDFYYSMVLFPPHRETPPLSEDGFWHTRRDSVWKDKELQTITIIFGLPIRNQIQEQREKVKKRPNLDDLLTNSNMESLFRKGMETYPKMHALKPHSPIHFTDLLKATGFTHDTCVWEENAEQLYIDQVIDFPEVPAFREDIWNDIVTRLPAGYSGGIGLATTVMNNARRGKYHSNGLDDDTRRFLLEIGLPDWYPAFLEKILYMFPKSHCIEMLLRSLEEIWLESEA